MRTGGGVGQLLCQTQVFSDFIFSPSFSFSFLLLFRLEEILKTSKLEKKQKKHFFSKNFSAFSTHQKNLYWYLTVYIQMARSNFQITDSFYIIFKTFMIKKSFNKSYLLFLGVSVLDFTFFERYFPTNSSKIIYFKPVHFLVLLGCISLPIPIFSVY